MLKKITLAPGVNQEVTQYSAEGTWYDTDKVRFRAGFPEKIGGWMRLSSNEYLGVCRSMFNWTTLTQQNLVSVGTHIKYYIESGGAYYDITPVRSTVTLNNPFDTTIGLSVVEVTDVAHGATTGDYVTFSGASAVGGITVSGEYEITVVDDDNYTIETGTAASSTANGGGASVSAAYQINIGSSEVVPFNGFGAGGWGSGTYGVGGDSLAAMRQWSQSNFGEDLVFAYRGSPLFYWDATNGLATRAVYLSALPGAADVPAEVNFVLVSDVSRFILVFGCNGTGATAFSPMRVRWGDQESAISWTPAATNQAGELELSKGTQIVTAKQSRQEILVWTDAALYSLQYVGAPAVWGAQLVGSETSIAGQNAVAFSRGVAYWMGRETFYRYDGTVTPLPCSVRRYVFNNFNAAQEDQVFAGTIERFNEVWWFYCSAASSTTDRYVVYNYVDNTWYYGELARSAWLESALRRNPIAATYNNKLVYHEEGVDDSEAAIPVAIASHATSAAFDLDDGDSFMFISRVLPDVTFDGSTSDNPSILMEFMPMKNSGAGFQSPASVGGNSSNTTQLITSVPVETFTDQAFVRIRGRQLAIRVSSSALGTTWQLGSTRYDLKPDGRRS